MFHSWETSTQKEGGERVGGKNRIMRGRRGGDEEREDYEKILPVLRFFFTYIIKFSLPTPSGGRFIIIHILKKRNARL